MSRIPQRGRVVLAASMLALACQSSPDVDDVPHDYCGCPDAWVDACVPDCAGRECGDDGCGGACGDCFARNRGNFCTADGHCVWADPPDCNGKVCGPDGMGGICGTCPQYEACSADGTTCLPCVPDCGGKECGPDGCGGTCPSSCACDNSIEICQVGVYCTCVEFGKASRVNALYVPADAFQPYGGADFANLGGSTCPDLDGDGVPDHGLAPLLGTLEGFGVRANDELLAFVQEGATHVLLGLGDGGDDFTLHGYLGQAGPNAGEYLVDPASFVDGAPWLQFEHAGIVDGGLNLGPVTFPLGPLLAHALAGVGLPLLDVTLDRVRLIATVDGVVDDAGVAFSDGTLGGVVFRADVDKALYLARKWCAENPDAPADVCGYVQMADLSLLETFLTWDQALPDCGKKLQLYDANDPLFVVGEEDNCQAASTCLFWAAEKARLTGLAPSQQE